MKVKVKTVDKTQKVIKDIQAFTRMQVYVGIPEEKAPRKGQGPSNAQLAFLHTHGVRSVSMRFSMTASMVKHSLNYSQALALYLHTHGSPLMQIPPRPIIEPAIKAHGNLEPITMELRAAATAALAGQRQKAMTHLHRAGLTAQNAVRAWFTDPRNHWAPNAPSTIARKGSDKPLIDTGELRKSITYVLSNSIVPSGGGAVTTEVTKKP